MMKSTRRITGMVLSLLMATIPLAAQTGSEIEYTGTVTDCVGNVYKTVRIGGQVWMAENLRVTKFNDGMAIPHVTGDSAWGSLSAPGYCFGSFPASTRDLFGAWYNWNAVNTGKLAPKGWHVPSVAEWKVLAKYLGGEPAAGGKMKSPGISYWLSPNTGATDSSGFSTFPEGYRNYDGSDHRHCTESFACSRKFL